MLLLVAYDKATGEVVGRVALPARPLGTPMTYPSRRPTVHRAHPAGGADGRPRPPRLVPKLTWLLKHEGAHLGLGLVSLRAFMNNAG